jgi:hypothetical protein
MSSLPSGSAKIAMWQTPVSKVRAEELDALGL